ncbi:MAG: DUF6644 family protein [Anditalea sp.]
MNSNTAHWLQWLENTPLAASIRQSLWLYPSLEIVHIIGITVLVGAAFMFDLRLLGFSKKLPIKDLGRHLLSWSQRGLWLILPSGILLFISNAEALGNDPVFWIKLFLIFIGALNAFIFHRFVIKFHNTWDESISTPPKAKFSACISLLVWIAVITCGRLLAY